MKNNIIKIILATIFEIIFFFSIFYFGGFDFFEVILLTFVALIVIAAVIYKFKKENFKSSLVFISCVGMATFIVLFLMLNVFVKFGLITVA